MVQYDLTERCNNPEKFILIRRISKVLFLVLFGIMNVGHFTFFENRIPYSAHNRRSPYKQYYSKSYCTVTVYLNIEITVRF